MVKITNDTIEGIADRFSSNHPANQTTLTFQGRSIAPVEFLERWSQMPPQESLKIPYRCQKLSFRGTHTSTSTPPLFLSIETRLREALKTTSESMAYLLLSEEEDQPLYHAAIESFSVAPKGTWHSVFACCEKHKPGLGLAFLDQKIKEGILDFPAPFLQKMTSKHFQNLKDQQEKLAYNEGSNFLDMLVFLFQDPFWQLWSWNLRVAHRAAIGLKISLDAGDSARYRALSEQRDPFSPEEFEHFLTDIYSLDLITTLKRYGGRRVLSMLPEVRPDLLQEREALPPIENKNPFFQNVITDGDFCLLFPADSDVRVQCAGLFTDCCMHVGHPQGAIYPRLCQESKDMAMLTITKKGRVVANSLAFFVRILDQETPAFVMNGLVHNLEITPEKVQGLLQQLKDKGPFGFFYPTPSIRVHKTFRPTQQATTEVDLETCRLPEEFLSITEAFKDQDQISTLCIDAHKISQI